MSIPVIFITIIPISAFGRSSRQAPKITLSGNNIPLKQVFEEIRLQTDISVINNEKETNLNEQKRVTVNFKQADIREVMFFLLNDRRTLSFTIRKKNVYIIKNLHIEKDQLDTLLNTIELIGRITNNEGEPIPGASIKIKNNKYGTISNTDGSFRISEIDKGSIIIITSIGYESKEIVINTSNIQVELLPHINTLDEKVIIAYGSTTKRLNTGNIGSIKAKDIENQLINNPLTALQGRTPGVFIEQASGLPGSGVTVRIQGINSIRGGRDPYYVIDGVPYISQLLPTENGTMGYSGSSAGNPLSYLNTADIESIEVLKDADATAIYGSRAANGAVLITTKKGKVGPVRVNVMAQSGWGKLGNKMDLLNTREYLEMRREALRNDGSAVSIFDYDLNGVWDTTRNVDWQKELLGNIARYTDMQFSTSGGNSFTQFLIGAGYHKETTVFPTDASDTKASVHINLNSNSANGKFKIQFTGSYLYDDNRLPLANLTSSALTLAPVAPKPYNEDGSINWMPDPEGSSSYFLNPMAYLSQKSNNKTSNITSNSIISYEVLPGLVLKSSFGYNNLLTNEIGRNPASILPPEYQPFIQNTTTFTTNRISSWIIEPQIEYQQKINKGTLNTLIGTTVTQQNNDQQKITGLGFSNELVMEDLSSATDFYASTINSQYKYNALYGRITYNWIAKYILNLSARRDGSSRFGSKNQFHNFGAVGAAWVFSQEPFIQSYLPILSYGKLRGSYGSTGSDQIGDYQFMNIYSPVFISGIPYQGIIGLTPNGLTNPYLQWEETRKFQMGIELGFINDKLLITANYNQNRSSNQLGAGPLTSITGAASLSRNIPATVQNTGWEFTLNSTNIRTKHFSWLTNFNITIPRNKLLTYFGKDKNNSYSIGKPLSSLQYYKFMGVDEATGKYQFQDSKGDLTATPSDPKDKIVILDTDPRFYGGLQNSLSYRGISLDFFFSFTKRSTTDKATYALRNELYPGTFQGGGANQTKSVLNRWKQPGDKASIQLYSAGNDINANYIRYSDAIIVDGSFIKLKNVALSWQIPLIWRKALHFQSGRVFMNAQNLFTISKYNGLDPETGLSLPPLRTITFGVQIIL